MQAQDTHTQDQQEHSEKEQASTLRMRPPLVLCELCLREHSSRSSCTRCKDLCPEGAIDLAGGVPQIDPALCLICDLCCNVCPTHAISSVAQPLIALDLAVQKAAELFDVAYITCSNTGIAAESESLVEVACLGSIPAELWFSILLRHPNVEVYLPSGLCDSCPVQCGEALMVEAITQAEIWAQSAMGLVGSHEELDYVIYESAQAGINRRDVLSNFAQTARNAARKGKSSDAAAQFKLQQARMRSALGAQRRARKERDAAFKQANETGVFKDSAKVLCEPRRILCDALHSYPEQAGTVRIQVAATASSCIGCGECAKICPTGARSIGVSLMEVDPLYCVGCGLCEDICPAAACKVSSRNAESLLESAENV